MPKVLVERIFTSKVRDFETAIIRSLGNTNGIATGLGNEIHAPLISQPTKRERTQANPSTTLLAERNRRLFGTTHDKTTDRDDRRNPRNIGTINPWSHGTRAPHLLTTGDNSTTRLSNADAFLEQDRSCSSTVKKS